MPSASLQAYLAANYLTASTPSGGADLSQRPKKRRKKDRPAEGVTIADDDEDLSLSSNPVAPKRRRPQFSAQQGEDEDGGDDTPQLYDGKVKSAEFRKKPGGGWKAVPDAIASTNTQTEEADDNDASDAAAANEILEAAAAADSERRRNIDEDDAPAVVEDDNAGGPKMESGVRAGLQTAADTARLVAAEEAARAEEERAARREQKRLRKQQQKDGEEVPLEQQTIYRDATGRRIDVSAKRAEAAQKERDKERERQREREAAMGDVQRKMREERKEELEEARFLTVARGVDDEDMNEDMKGVRRWGDPMAGYAVEDDGGGAVAGTKGKEGKVALEKGAKKKKKEYVGAAPPNRYGIVPGWRWDGVDRGNGFEKEWFQARSRKTRNEDMSYQWQMDE